MNTGKVANAVVRRLEAATPVYDVSEHGYSPYVSLVDGRDLIVDAPFEGDVRITPGVRTYEGGLPLLEDLEAELRVRDDVGGWAW
jgi:hypothetical protein